MMHLPIARIVVPLIVVGYGALRRAQGSYQDTPCHLLSQHPHAHQSSASPLIETFDSRAAAFIETGESFAN